MSMKVQFLKGQSSKFKAEGFSPVSTTFYFLEDTLELYLGSKLLSNEVTAAQFAALEARVKALEDADFQGQINAINETLKSIATSATVEAIDERLKVVEGDYLKKADKEALQAEIDADVKVVTDLLASDYSTKAVADTLYAGKAYENKVDTLVGEDAGVSVRTIAASEVAKVVANADEDFDTLKEIADWIASDSTGAAAMSNAIEALKKEIGGEQTADGFTNSRIDTLEGKVDVEKVSTAISAATADMATNTGVDAKLANYVTIEAHNTFVSENDALQSGITADKVRSYDGIVDSIGDYAKTADIAGSLEKAESAVQPAAIADMATKTEVDSTYLKKEDKYDDTAVVERVTALEGRFEGTNAQVADIVKAVNKLADNSESTEIVLANITNNTKGNAEAIANIETQLTWGSF